MCVFVCVHMGQDLLLQLPLGNLLILLQAGSSWHTSFILVLLIEQKRQVIPSRCKGRRETRANTDVVIGQSNQFAIAMTVVVVVIVVVITPFASSACKNKNKNKTKKKQIQIV